VYEESSLQCRRCHDFTHPVEDCPAQVICTESSPLDTLIPPPTRQSQPLSLDTAHSHTRASQLRQIIHEKPIPRRYNKHSAHRSPIPRPKPSLDQDGFILVPTRRQGRKSPTPTSSNHYWERRVSMERKREDPNYIEPPLVFHQIPSRSNPSTEKGLDPTKTLISKLIVLPTTLMPIHVVFPNTLFPSPSPHGSPQSVSYNRLCR